MRIIQKFEAEDGTLFATHADCAEYEDQLPFVRLFAEVESAVKADAAFAAKIEALGTKLARERRASGDLKRTRGAKADPVPAAPDAESEAGMKSQLVDFVVFQFAETDKAVQVGEDETDRSKAVWLPKSQIGISEKVVVNGVLFHDLTLPEWLAQERGLV